MARTTLSPCPRCGAVNRVDLDRAEQGGAVCSRCQAPLELSGAVSEVDGRGLEAVLRRATVPVVVDFWAEWCGPCKAFAPIYSAAARRRAGKIVFLKLDTEQDPQTAQRFGVRAIPTLVLFRAGRETKRQAGALPPSALDGWLDEAAG